MTEKTIYVSFTGKEFTDKDECAAYENDMNDLITNGTSYIRKIKSFCVDRTCDSTCPFRSSESYSCIFCDEPFNWNLSKYEEKERE